MTRWFFLFAVGWLASIAWLNHFVVKGSETYWNHLLHLAGATSLPTLVLILIVLRLWRCGPSLERTLGILSLPLIGLAIAWLPVAVTMDVHGDVKPDYSDYFKLAGWGALPGIVAWWGFLFFHPDFP
jgi:hypothetical protein